MDPDDTTTVYTLGTDVTVCVPENVVESTMKSLSRSTAKECHVLPDSGSGKDPEDGKSISE